jgi:hypothetical protein
VRPVVASDLAPLTRVKPFRGDFQTRFASLLSYIARLQSIERQCDERSERDHQSVFAERSAARLARPSADQEAEEKSQNASR